MITQEVVHQPGRARARAPAEPMAACRHRSGGCAGRGHRAACWDFSWSAARSGTLGTAASYLPADTVMYGEVRLDLSPAQAGSLSRDPGALPRGGCRHRAARCDRRGHGPGPGHDRFVADATPRTSRPGSTDAWPSPRSTIPWPRPCDVANAKLPRMAALLGVKNAAAATAFGDALRDLASQSNVTLTSSQHAGVTDLVHSRFGHELLVCLRRHG